MKHIIYILMALILLAGAATPTMAQQKPTAAQIQKQKEAEAKKKAAEKAKAKKAKEKAKAQKAKAKEQAARDKERAKKDAEKAKVQAAREKAAAQQRAEIEKQKEAYYRQEAEKEGKVAAKELPVHYFNLAPRIGYSAMFDNLSAVGKTLPDDPAAYPFMNKQLVGGFGAGLQFSYNLEFKHFLFETGVTFDYLNSTSRYAFTQVRHENTYNADYHYTTDRMSESRNLGYLSLPLMFGGEFGNFYFLVGPRIGYGLMSFTKSKGLYDVTVYDPGLIDPYGMGIHPIPTKAGEGAFKVQPLDIRACLELGMDLDQWLQAQPDKKKMRGVKPGQRIPFGKEHVHYRVGLFAEYAVTNSNDTPTGYTPLAFESNSGKDAYIATATNSVLAAGSTEPNLFGTQGNKMNNLFVGAKFTIQFEVPGKVRRPVPPPPSYLNVRVVDSETGEVLKTSILTVTDNAKKKQVVKQKALAKGLLRQRLNVGEYTADIVCDNYYGQTIAFSIDSVDQMLDMPIRLKKIPAPEPVVIPVVEKGETFVLKNLYFATNKTRILDISEPALQELADYLKRNADIRIKIIGHTDNIGKEKTNQHLSEGRAEAVRDALVEKGIDKARLEFEGRGESEPIDTNDTEEGRQNNRRVVIEIL